MKKILFVLAFIVFAPVYALGYISAMFWFIFITGWMFSSNQIENNLRGSNDNESC